VDPHTGAVAEEDREAIAEAELPDAIARSLLLEDEASPAFVSRFQQTSPPVMAKGVEDTAFYRYARLVALNEVGGDPSRFGITVEQFHAANRERAGRYPRNLLITQTHDTKRSGDARARVGALSAMAGEWAACVREWFGINEPLRTDGAPDRVEEYFIYQNLIAAWPIEPERLDGYMEKALREAKRNTNWAEVNEDYEARVKRFCRGLYDHKPFRDAFAPFARRVAEAGERSSLAQLLIKLTAPGIADIYQGDELVSLSLVDPDNRRPVDWERRRAALTAVRDGSAPDDPDSRKLRLIVAALDLRKRKPDAFTGSYEPVDAGDDAIAYIRGGAVFVAAAIRPNAQLPQPAGEWRSLVASPDLALSELL
jgi:(1->4)-alpha-D-glucan 1-alpha-D-glucosylmutase